MASLAVTEDEIRDLETTLRQRLAEFCRGIDVTLAIADHEVVAAWSGGSGPEIVAVWLRDQLPQGGRIDSLVAMPRRVVRVWMG